MTILRVLAALALLPLAACTGGDAYREAAEARFPPVGQFVEVEGLKIHYVDKGAGPAVVLIHGANGNLRDWTFSLFDRLAADHRVVALDRPGQGYSDRPAESGPDPRVQARILRDAAAALGVERPVVVGHSWGGAVAAAWALAYPHEISGLVLLAAATQPWGGGGGALYALGASDLVGGLMGAAARSYATGARLDGLIDDVFAPDPTPAGYVDHIGVQLALRPAAFRANAEDIDLLNGYLEQMAPGYGGLEMPVEILHGDADETVGHKIHSLPTWRAAPNANITIFPGVGHMVHHAREDATLAAIRRVTGVDVPGVNTD